MKTIGKAHINPAKIMKDDELIKLKGGEAGFWIECWEYGSMQSGCMGTYFGPTYFLGDCVYGDEAVIICNAMYSGSTCAEYPSANNC